MQKGRLREFAQLNMDIVGVAGVAADAELIAAAVAMMTDLGFGSDDFAVRVSSRTLMEDVFSALGVAPAAVPALFRLLDKRHKADEGAFMRELRGTVGDTTAGALRDVLGIQDLGEIARQFPRAGSARAIEEIFGLFGTYGVADFVTFDIGIVRGLAYYTGIVFELIDRGRTMRAIAGGGRYDTLISLYGGPETPAVGFAAGDVVLGEMCAAKGIAIPRPARSQVYVVSVGPAARDETVRTAQALRKAGISCEFSLHQAPLHKQLSLADTGRSRFAVFVGGDEAREGKVKIKDMATGNEWLVDTSTLTEELSGKTS
jgi:histidyl-tRNA synthetase